MRSSLPACLTFVLSLPACLGASAELSSPHASAPAPPIAKRIAHELVAHGHTRVDHYYWLRERGDPEVIAYLEAENAYTEAATAHTAKLRAELQAELTGRIQQDDSTVPVRERDYFYYARWVEGSEHPLYCRKHGSLDADEEIILNADALAKGHDFFATRELEVSENQQLLAYATDDVGRRFYTIHVKDLRTGELLADEIPDVSGALEWANDDQTLLYTKQDPETLRDYQVFRHTLGDAPGDDTLIYEERDETFEVGLWKTKSRAYLVLDIYSTLSDEVRILDAAKPDAELRVFAPRERGLEYDIDHLGDQFYVRTNLDAENFRLMKTPVAKTDKQHWREVVGHRDDVLIESFELFDEHLVLEQRRRGLMELSVQRWDGSDAHVLDFGEPAYVAYGTGNLELDTSTLRYGYSSMTTPDSVFDYDMNTREKVLLKQQKVLGGFAPEDYVTERLDAPARDGAAVPISLVYRRGPQGRPEPGPALVYAYGSYGASMDADFSANVLSLLDRGFVFAIAHVRGGEELGRAWYEGGKLLNKKNTFTDFIDSAQFLVDEGYAERSQVFAEGGSAGGLLIGAVINMRPDLFAGAIAAVPFVDVVTTMLDDSIPLTTSEYDEWGNPNDKQYYDYMLSYSPYDNVTAQDYPPLLVTTGLHDSQVQYWEPAKWVAKLRATKTGDDLLLLRTDMSSGHGGKSGRLARLEEIAFEFAFLLDLAGRAD
ncbi:Protease 2 [Enhygromyxa salina]|uniref:Protease 2 n=1 Tax=Enhygromyxa salina TaxID=215803 RepID=A0A2S9YBP9_9BACT|nr:S9 family peptidase [Enhygromyxa salina]PRQ02436.1 Protease 2 [Enhygromyxa salina]